MMEITSHTPPNTHSDTAELKIHRTHSHIAHTLTPPPTFPAQTLPFGRANIINKLAQHKRLITVFCCNWNKKNSQSRAPQLGQLKSTVVMWQLQPSWSVTSPYLANTATSLYENVLINYAIQRSGVWHIFLYINFKYIYIYIYIYIYNLLFLYSS